MYVLSYVQLCQPAHIRLSLFCILSSPFSCTFDLGTVTFPSICTLPTLRISVSFCDPWFHYCWLCCHIKALIVTFAVSDKTYFAPCKPSAKIRSVFRSNSNIPKLFPKIDKTVLHIVIWRHFLQSKQGFIFEIKISSGYFDARYEKWNKNKKNIVMSNFLFLAFVMINLLILLIKKFQKWTFF